MACTILSGPCDKRGKVVLWEKESDNAFHKGHLCPIKSYSKFTPPFSKKEVDNLKRQSYYSFIRKKFLNIKLHSGHQTEEVEIKTVDALTERPDAEKGWKCRLLNGPRRALRNEAATHQSMGRR